MTAKAGRLVTRKFMSSAREYCGGMSMCLRTWPLPHSLLCFALEELEEVLGSLLREHPVGTLVVCYGPLLKGDRRMKTAANAVSFNVLICGWYRVYHLTHNHKNLEKHMH